LGRPLTGREIPGDPIAGLIAVCIIPWFKYPANPPSFGDLGTPVTLTPENEPGIRAASNARGAASLAATALHFSAAGRPIRIGPRPPISMDTMYADLLALGRIFGVSSQAEALVADYRGRVAVVTERTGHVEQRPRIMYCGGCNNDNPPRTIGTEGMPRLLFDLAGGRNIFDDIKDSYVNVNWETVIDRDPEWIVISNPRIPHEDSIAYLTSSSALRNITAVKKRQFLFMTYAERSPSTGIPANVLPLYGLAGTSMQ
jgi:ABC-type Fe3+-hydroxamate transport system substrate-binding protein